MKLSSVLHLALVLGMLPDGATAMSSVPSPPPSLRNDRYVLTPNPGGSLELATIDGGIRKVFEGRFAVIRAESDPKFGMRYLDIPNVRYHGAAWMSATGKVSPMRRTDTSVEGGDGFESQPQVQKSDGKTVDVFQAGTTCTMQATGAKIEDRRIVWSFAPEEAFTLSASVELPSGSALPKLVFTLRPKKEGWYSVGYIGAPASDLSSVSELWQQLIWQEKRFPPEPILTPAGYCTLPATLVTVSGATAGVIADPSEMPFSPLPYWKNSRFGVAVRNGEGKAQPMIFAPILGGPGSQMSAGAEFSFGIRLFLGPDGVSGSYEELARSLYGFRDYRENVVSLNTTIENIIDYGLSEFSRFDDNLKGCMYETDVPGAVKNVSALHPMEMALVTDNEAIFRQRALPILEFLISREKFLFVMDPAVKTQSPSRLMHGPCAEGSEFAVAYAFGGKNSPVLLGFAEELAKAKLKSKKLDSWVQQLALYHSLGDPELLGQAVAGADEYLAHRLAKPEEEFDGSEASGSFFFWTAYSPLWINLLDLYEATGEVRFLEAAHKGAREFTQFVMMSPKIPAGNITVNPGGQAPQYPYLKSKSKGPISAPEESVPAWRVSEIGLTPESSSTVLSHRAIFMANFAPWMMRLSVLAGDSFLHDVARSAIVGRYANFPGYHMNTDRTTVYEKPDYPYRSHSELSYNSFHYNHPWPQAALLLDYLVNDVFAKSGGRIDFPGRYAQGYGYLQSRVYGDRPGVCFGEKNVRLWMPKGLVTIDSPQINYLAARRENTLFIALANQSHEAVKTVLHLNPGLVGFPVGQELEVSVLSDDLQATTSTMQNGTLTVSVPADGLTALQIEGATLHVAFQDRFAASAEAPAAKEPLAIQVGDARAMALSFGADLNTAYIYLRETDGTLKSATLHYRQGGEWKTETDASYPFEFSVPIDPARGGLEFSLETLGLDGEISKSDSTFLPSASKPASPK